MAIKPTIMVTMAARAENRFQNAPSSSTTAMGGVIAAVNAPCAAYMEPKDM